MFIEGADLSVRVVNVE